MFCNLILWLNNSNFRRHRNWTQCLMGSASTTTATQLWSASARTSSYLLRASRLIEQLMTIESVSEQHTVGRADRAPVSKRDWCQSINSALGYADRVKTIVGDEKKRRRNHAVCFKLPAPLVYFVESKSIISLRMT